MSRVWMTCPLETVATYWRIHRTDGVSLGFTSHDVDLWFDGLAHGAAPGMEPAAIRRGGDFTADATQIRGAISHAAISAAGLRGGRFEGARVMVGLVDWKTLEHQILYRGTVGAVQDEAGGFVVGLQSRKVELERNPVPRTSPACRAAFCGKECGLSAPRFSHEARLVHHDCQLQGVVLDAPVAQDALMGGHVRWVDGPYAGVVMDIVGQQNGYLALGRPLDGQLPAGLRAEVREGCDRTIATCAARFDNAANFRGEPFLPGNDQLIRYGSPA